MIENIKPKIKCLVCDIDNTLLNLRSNRYASILNADILIPVLRFASLIMPIAIDTARDKYLDNDLLASGGVSVTDLLEFMGKEGVHFSEKSPDLIIMSESVMSVREQYMSQFQYRTPGWNKFVAEKNPDLHLIMDRINEHRKGQADFVPLKPEDILILDDSNSVVQKAMEAGFQAKLVPLDFTPNAVDTMNVDYLYELAELIGLAEYAENLVKNPKAYRKDPKEFVAIAKQYLKAKENRSKAGPVARCIVHMELEQNLVQLIETTPKLVYQILLKFKEKGNFNQLIDQQSTLPGSELQRTMLGMAIIEDNCVVVSWLLQLGANPQQVFDLNYKNQSATPMLAAILTNSRTEIFKALYHANAKLQNSYCEQAVLEIAITSLQEALAEHKSEPSDEIKPTQNDAYRKLEIVVLSLQRHEGKEAYLNQLLPLFFSIFHKRDIKLLNLCLLHLEPEHKEKLIACFLIKDKRAKTIKLDRMGSDGFDGCFVQHFFFQIPEKILCPLLNSSVKPVSILSQPKPLSEEETQLNELLQLLKNTFMLENEKKRQLLTGKKSGSGFFKPKNTQPCPAHERFVLFTIYLEQVIRSGQLDRHQNELLMNTALSTLKSLKITELYSSPIKSQIDDAINFLEKILSTGGSSIAPHAKSSLFLWNANDAGSSSMLGPITSTVEVTTVNSNSSLN